MLKHILKIQCIDKAGIVAAVATALADTNCNIEQSAQFHEPLSGHFFMRVELLPQDDSALRLFQDRFRAIAHVNAMQYSLTPVNEAIKTLILASKTDHCVNDLLHRTKHRHLNIDIVGVASNHETNRNLVEHHGLPYHYLPITPNTKGKQEKQIRDLIDSSDAELIIMARYMQVLSNDFCNDYAGRVINIHHSFLPGFKGAKPYHQAYERGVKIIGATAHFATADLDEGPIIKQEIIPIDHSYSPRALQTLGRDNEARVLARAVDDYSQRRIFLHNNRTVIL